LPLSSRYLIRETGGNLRRNLVMTIAAIVTMVVSLAALGGVLIMREAINKQSIMWRGGVTVAIFLDSNVSNNEVKAIGQVLATTPGVKSDHFVDKTESLAQFHTIFAANKAFMRVMDLQSIPPRYDVVPTSTANVSQLQNVFTKQPGVLKVTYAAAEIHALQARFRVLKYIALFLAIGVMVGAIALIINTIQLAIFARRREVAVMKLVGATNLFIRIPFMLEGLIHGVVGAALAFVAIYFARDTIASFIGNDSAISIQTASPYVTSHDAILTGILILVVGALVGVIGSAFAVRRFLQV
jgi:cell division transport system permease protein